MNTIIIIHEQNYYPSRRPLLSFMNTIIIIHEHHYYITIIYRCIYTLSGPPSSALAWHSDGRAFASQRLQRLEIYDPHLHRAIRGAHGALPCVGCGVTVSQLDQPSLPPLFAACCGRLKLGAPIGLFQ